MPVLFAKLLGWGLERGVPGLAFLFTGGCYLAAEAVLREANAQAPKRLATEGGRVRREPAVQGVMDNQRGEADFRAQPDPSKYLDVYKVLLRPSRCFFIAY